MSSTDFLARVFRIALAAFAVAIALRLLVGARVFGIYGLPVVVLLALPFLHRTLANRLRDLGQPARKALYWTLPAGLLAAVDIGYWAAFFSGPGNRAVLLGVARQFALDYAGPLLPWIALVALAAFAAFLYRLAQDRGGE